MKNPEFDKLIISDDISKSKAFRITTYSILGVVSLGMTVLNILTDKGFLTVCTGIFAGLCLINILLTLFGQLPGRIATILFGIETLCLFTFFLVSGNPDGFSAIWICMLPSLGMIFFDRFRGSILCAIMFVILAFLLWTPVGQSLLMYDYNMTFKMRFPVLFLAFHLLAFGVESLRVNAYNQMRKMQDHYRDLSVRDQLTGVFNRQGMYSALESNNGFKKAEKIGVAIFDIDHFKKINDTYGHNMGDAVLKEFSKTLKESVNRPVCRWGGEEFIVIFFNDGLTEADFRAVKDKIQQHEYVSNGKTFNITASIGICSEVKTDFTDIDRLIGYADSALYKAKSTGRNKIVYFNV